LAELSARGYVLEPLAASAKLSSHGHVPEPLVAVAA